jgi:anion-transporting  ArsA/GET3 family ATPase
MANGAVAAVKKGCQLYKEIRGAAGQVKDVLNDLDKTFRAQHKDKPPTPEQTKQYHEERERVKHVANSDPNDVISQVGEQLGTFFDAFDKIEKVFWEEERAAKRLYTGDESLSKRALQRVLIRSRLQMMETEIREQMIYHSPPELKDLWGRFEKMRAQITEEQEAARAEQHRKDALAAWQRQQIRNAVEDNLIWLVVLLLVAAEVMGVLWTILLHRQNALPSWPGLPS